MNKTIFKNLFKSNFKFILIFVSVLSVYLGIIISLIDTSGIEKVKELFGTMGDMLSVFGISTESMTSPLAYTASTFFAVLIIAFTMVYYLFIVNKIIVKPIETTSIVSTLSTPITRVKFSITQIIFIIVSMLILFLSILLVGSIMLNNLGDFDFLAYFNLVSLFYLLTTMVAILSYTLAVIFTNTKFKSLYMIVPIAFIILNMLSNAGGEKLSLINLITPFGWLDSMEIINENANILGLYILLISLILILSFVSVKVFKNKNLTI